MSLADFYGIAPSTAADVPAGGSGGGVGDDADSVDRRPLDSGRTHLSSEEFDSQAYLGGLLAQKSMRDLIQHDNQMISSKRALDSEMQTLVYENYNKFISATDMIRKMKSNVESMEHQMANLLENMNAISKNCQGIESSLTPNRAKVENLLGVSRLLKRLEFLFELPGKLKKAIELGAYEQAVKYFRISSSILEQYKHHKSFEHIRKESEQIIGELKSKLRNLIRDPTLTSDQQMSYTAMLVLDLGEPDSPQLINALIEAQRAKFQAAMNKAVELAGKNSTARRTSLTQQQERKEDADDAASSSPAPSSPSSSDGNLLALLQQHFLAPYVIFSDTYLATLVRPYEAKRQKLTQALAEQKQQQAEDAAAGVKPKTGAAQSATVDSATVSLQHLTTSLHLSQDGLTSLTVDLFHAYFTLARRELLKRATIGTGPKVDASQVILGFTATLKNFYEGVAKPVQMLPRAKLADRAQELVHHALTHCVEAICEHVLHNCVAKLAEAHETVVNWRPGLQGYTVSPTAVSAALRSAVDSGLGLLVVVLSTREYLPESVSSALSFGDLARAHALQMMTNVEREMTYRTPRRQELVQDASVLTQTALSKAIGEKLAKKGASEKESRAPLFYLFLSQVAHQQETKDIPAALRTLSKFFPVASSRGNRRGEASASQQDHIPLELVARAKEATQGLLLRYCETQGFQVTEMVRSYLAAQGASGEPRHPSELVDHLQSHFHRILSELSLIFPRGREEQVKDRNHDASGRDLLGRNNPATGRAGAGKDGKSLQSSRGTGAGGINREIQRLFTQKIVTFAGVDADGVTTDVAMNRTAPMVAICKIAFKAMTECVRVEVSARAGSELATRLLDARMMLHEVTPIAVTVLTLMTITCPTDSTRAERLAALLAPCKRMLIFHLVLLRSLQRLTAGAFHQLQLDIFTLRQELLHFLPEASSDACKELYVLLDEALNSAQERAPNVTPLDEYALEDAYNSSRAQKPASTGQEAASDVPAAASAAASEDASSFYSAAASAPKGDGAPTGALARLVLSSPNHTTRAEQHISPTEVMQKAHARNPSNQ
jgi:hypothetical protein